MSLSKGGGAVVEFDFVLRCFALGFLFFLTCHLYRLLSGQTVPLLLSVKDLRIDAAFLHQFG